MSGIFRYSIIRFRPYAETGEFANIGVIVFDISTGVARYRLARKRFARIGHFFDTHAHVAYSHAIEGLRVELPRMIEFIPETFSRSAIEQFSDLLEGHESSILFSPPRVIKSDKPIDALSDYLFDRFVRREFDKEENAEAVLTKNIRRSLNQLGVKHFKSVTIPDEIVPLTFPLGYRGIELAAIKPLAFHHKSPLHVLDYGAYWTKRLAYHLNKNNLNGDSVFLAIEGPQFIDDDQFDDAFNLALEELRTLPFPISIVEHGSQIVPQKLHEFVEQHPPIQSRMMH